MEKTPGLGARIDIALTLVRIGMFYGDRELVTEYISKAERYVYVIHIMPAPSNSYIAWSTKVEIGTDVTGLKSTVESTYYLCASSNGHQSCYSTLSGER